MSAGFAGVDGEDVESANAVLAPGPWPDPTAMAPSGVLASTTAQVTDGDSWGYSRRRADMAGTLGADPEQTFSCLVQLVQFK